MLLNQVYSGKLKVGFLSTQQVRLLEEARKNCIYCTLSDCEYIWDLIVCIKWPICPAWETSTFIFLNFPFTNSNSYTFFFLHSLSCPRTPAKRGQLCFSVLEDTGNWKEESLHQFCCCSLCPQLGHSWRPVNCVDACPLLQSCLW
jgi:hypothetical protein